MIQTDVILSVQGSNLSSAFHPSNAMIAADVSHRLGTGMIAVSLTFIRYDCDLTGETLIDHDAPELRIHKVAMTVLHAEPHLIAGLIPDR